MSLKLYIGKNLQKAPIVAKILVAANYTKLKLEIVEIELGKDNKTEEFKKKNPNGTIPVLEVNGKYIWESNSILKYIAKEGKVLLGENNLENVEIAQWLDFIAQNLFIPGHPIIAHACGCGKAPSKGVKKEASEKIAKAMEIFNSHLKHYTYLVGERVSIADISLVTILESLSKKHFTDEDKSKYKSVFRLYKTVSAQPQYQAVFGEGKKKVKSTFNLEEWKRKYMNTDPRTESIPYFFEKVDRKVNVVYFCDYKYPEDCQKSFMTRNLIGGVMRRFSPFAKTAFGTFVILGTEEKHTFKGMFLLESPDGEIPKTFREVDDFEIFEWRKGDFEADKERISDFLAWDRPIDGMPVIDGKVFR